MKNGWFGWVLAIGVTLMAYQAWAEEIKISTYYPSPYGSYTTLDAATILNVGPAGAPTITLSGSGAINAGSLVASGTVSGTDLNGTRVTATADVNAANVIASTNVSGGTVTAQGAVTGSSLNIAGGMTIKGASTGAGDLQIANNGGKYYCYAVYA